MNTEIALSEDKKNAFMALAEKARHDPVLSGKLDSASDAAALDKILSEYQCNLSGSEFMDVMKMITANGTMSHSLSDSDLDKIAGGGAWGKLIGTALGGTVGGVAGFFGAGVGAFAGAGAGAAIGAVVGNTVEEVGGSILRKL